MMGLLEVQGCISEGRVCIIHWENDTASERGVAFDVGLPGRHGNEDRLGRVKGLVIR